MLARVQLLPIFDWRIGLPAGCQIQNAFHAAIRKNNLPITVLNAVYISDWQSIGAGV
jgi:hypothetical protein